MMAEVKITVSGDAKGATDAFKEVQNTFKKVADDLKERTRAIGIAFTAIGGSITAIAGLAVKSSLEQQIGITRLDQALKNVGETYGANVKAIEAVIDATEKKTNYSDEQQREALTTLISIGGEWEGSLEALAVTTDIAANRNIDLNAAALLVGKAIAGEEGGLSRLGIKLEEGATQTEIMAALTKQFGGAAEAAANPMMQLTNNVDNLMQVMGDALLPIVSAAATAIGNIATKAQEWAEAHPQLAKWLSIVTAALGLLMLGLGALILMLPGLIAGIGSLGIAFATLAIGAKAAWTAITGPIGLIVLAITGLVAVGILLWKNWDTVWSAVTKATEVAVNFLINGFNKLPFVYREGLVVLLEAVQKVASVFSQEFAAKIQVAIDALKRGVPQIDITKEKVAALGNVTAETADTAKTSFGAISTSSERMAGGVTESSRKVVAAVRTIITEYDEMGIAIIENVDDVAKKMIASAKKDGEDLINLLREQREIEAKSEAYWNNVIAEQETADFQKLLAESRAFFATKLADQQAHNEQMANINAQMIKDSALALKINTENTEREHDRVKSSWNGVRTSLDPVLSKLRAFGVDATNIIGAWAQTVEVDTATIIKYLTDAGIKTGDLKLIFRLFQEAVGGDFDKAATSAVNWAENTKNALASVADAAGVTGSSLKQLQMAAAASAASSVGAAMAGSIAAQAAAMAKQAASIMSAVLAQNIPAMRAAVEARLIPVFDPETGEMGPSPFVMPSAIQEALVAMWGMASATGSPTVIDAVTSAIGALISAMKDKITADIAAGVPSFAHGGIVAGTRGLPQLVMAHGGETITPAGHGAGSVNVTINNPVVYGDMDLEQIIVRAVRGVWRRGGLQELLQPRSPGLILR